MTTCKRCTKARLSLVKKMLCIYDNKDKLSELLDNLQRNIDKDYNEIILLVRYCDSFEDVKRVKIYKYPYSVRYCNGCKKFNMFCLDKMRGHGRCLDCRGFAIPGIHY